MTWCQIIFLCGNEELLSERNDKSVEYKNLDDNERMIINIKRTTENNVWTM